MSNTQYAFLKREHVPSREKLQASIDNLGFNLKLDPEFTPFKDAGFSPCILEGTTDVGFEVFYSPALDVISDDSDFLKLVEGKDFSISMVWHGSMKDCACAMIVSCALAKDFDALISYQGENPVSIETLIQYTNEAISEALMEQPRKIQHQAILAKAKPWWQFW